MNLRPLPHFVLAKLRYNAPSIDGQEATIREPKDLLPHELPARVVKHLIAFLKGIHPIPPASISALIPPSEAAGARRAFWQLLKAGFSPGDAIIELGILTKKEWSNVPQTCFAEVLQRNCDCSAPKEGETGLVASSAGERLGGSVRILRCNEFLSRVIDPPEPLTH